jgi:hypothetical protein
MENINNHLESFIETSEYWDRLERKVYESDNLKYYSTVFHVLTGVFQLDTSVKIMVFANVEGLSRNGLACILNTETLAEYSGCSPKQLNETLEELSQVGFIERGEFKGKSGWKLIKEVRNLVDGLRKKQRNIRAKRYSKP